jgi:hypothetical protein
MPERIRTDEGYLTDLGAKLGEERMATFMRGQASVQAMSLFLVMAVTSAPQAGYCDTALDALISDAEDLRKAAGAWADSCIALAESWRAQRLTDEKGKR